MKNSTNDVNPGNFSIPVFKNTPEEVTAVVKVSNILGAANTTRNGYMKKNTKRTK